MLLSSIIPFSSLLSHRFHFYLVFSSGSGVRGIAQKAVYRGRTSAALPLSSLTNTNFKTNVKHDARRASEGKWWNMQVRDGWLQRMQCKALRQRCSSAILQWPEAGVMPGSCGIPNRGETSDCSLDVFLIILKNMRIAGICVREYLLLSLPGPVIHTGHCRPSVRVFGCHQHESMRKRKIEFVFIPA